MWRFQAIRLAESNYATPKLDRVLVAYLHILLSDGDAVGDGGPVGVNQEPTSEVSHPPALGVLDDLHPEARGDAAVADPIAEALLQQKVKPLQYFSFYNTKHWLLCIISHLQGQEFSKFWCLILTLILT